MVTSYRNDELPLTEPAVFLSIIAAEIDRSRRYQHTFTLLLLKRAQRPHSEANPIEALVRVAKEARSLVRGCDWVAAFDGLSLFAVLLPETRADGAGIVLDRFGTKISDPDGSWDVELMVFPYDRDAIDAFADNARKKQTAQATPPPLVA